MPTPAHPERIWHPAFHKAFGGNQTQSATTAWFLYLGYVDAPVTISRVGVQLTTNGAGTQAGELALASSPVGSNGTGQILSILTAQAISSSLTNGTTPRIIENTSLFSQYVPAGTHLWAGIRTAMGTTQVGLNEGTSKMALGDVLGLGDSPAALTSFTTVNATLPPQAVINHGPPYLWATEDA